MITPRRGEGYSETLYDVIDNTMVILEFSEGNISESEVLIPDTCLTANNATDNVNVSHFISSNPDTQNISVNSLAYSPREMPSYSDNLELGNRENDPHVILNGIKA